MQSEYASAIERQNPSSKFTRLAKYPFRINKEKNWQFFKVYDSFDLEQVKKIALQYVGADQITENTYLNYYEKIFVNEIEINWKNISFKKTLSHIKFMLY